MNFMGGFHLMITELPCNPPHGDRNQNYQIMTFLLPHVRCALVQALRACWRPQTPHCIVDGT